MTPGPADAAAALRSGGDPARADLDARVLAWIAEWRAALASGGAAPAADDARFDGLARELFAFQVARCAPWARYCAVRGATPERIASWREIPPVPAAAFKELALRSFPAERERHVFRTSGTSSAIVSPASARSCSARIAGATSAGFAITRSTPSTSSRRQPLMRS